MIRENTEIAVGKRRTRPLPCRNYAIGVRCAARPVHLPPGQINEWLDNSGLAPATAALVKGLLYPHGDRLLLADTATVVKEVPDAGTAQRTHIA